MSSSRRSTASRERLTILTILESAGLLAILLSDLGISILTLKARFKIWRWRSTRRFRSKLENAKMPKDLIDYLANKYNEHLYQDMPINKLLGAKLIASILRYTKSHKNTKTK
ncbi:MAG: hypothetical protein F7B59_07430 [Desulfurococcales archaeon]|nr:hypothetical protein [Desulfurococcales archaeon]